MGTRMAVAYANIFMGDLECNLFSNLSLRILFYKIYIDDILIITDDTETNLTNFIQQLNPQSNSQLNMTMTRFPF